MKRHANPRLLPPRQRASQVGRPEKLQFLKKMLPKIVFWGDSVGIFQDFLILNGMPFQRSSLQGSEPSGSPREIAVFEAK